MQGDGELKDWLHETGKDIGKMVGDHLKKTAKDKSYWYGGPKGEILQEINALMNNRPVSTVAPSYRWRRATGGAGAICATYDVVVASIQGLGPRILGPWVW